MTSAQNDKYTAMMEEIFLLLASRGIKATSMDAVAAHLHMSKRTLYEMFSSKVDMVKQMIAHMSEVTGHRYERLFAESETVLDAIITVLGEHLRFMTRLSPSFIADLYEIYPERKSQPVRDDKRNRQLMHILRQGIEEGVFRADLDPELQVRAINVQCEALKLMEPRLSSEEHAQSVVACIMQGMLRALVSEKGMRILDAKMQDLDFLNHPEK